MTEINLRHVEGTAIRELIRFTRERLDLLSDDAKTVFFMEFGKEFMSDMKANRPDVRKRK